MDKILNLNMVSLGKTLYIFLKNFSIHIDPRTSVTVIYLYKDPNI